MFMFIPVLFKLTVTITETEKNESVDTIEKCINWKMSRVNFL